jgi:hypothetical protein
MQPRYTWSGNTNLQIDYSQIWKPKLEDNLFSIFHLINFYLEILDNGVMIIINQIQQILSTLIKATLNGVLTSIPNYLKMNILA